MVHNIECEQLILLST